jgi:hypothetical protein
MVFRLQTQLLIHCSEMWYGQSTTYSCCINVELAHLEAHDFTINRSDRHVSTYIMSLGEVTGIA